MTRARWAALGMAVLLALYLVLITFYAVRLVTDPLPIVRGIGWALIVLPLLGAWALAVEKRVREGLEPATSFATPGVRLDAEDAGQDADHVAVEDRERSVERERQHGRSGVGADAW